MAERLIVDANYRFIAASQEVNARISQRQQALALYITLTVSLLAALVALRPGEGHAGAPVEWLVPGFPVASLCLAFLNFKAERAITNLRQFLATLERLNHVHHALPSFNTDPKWAREANRARRFHDFAAAILVAGGNGIGLGAAARIYPQRFSEVPYVLWISVLIAVVSLIILVALPRWSYRPTEEGI